MSIKNEDRVESQLRLFEAISETIPDFLYVFDLQGRFLYANRRLLEVWGISLKDAVGKSLYELGYPKWHADMHMKELSQVIETKLAIKGEVPFTGGSGISGVYEYIFSPVLGLEGQVEIIAGTTRDVTDRRQAQEQSRTILESITDGFFALDRDFRFTYANPQAERVLDRQPHDLLGKVIWDVYPGLDETEFGLVYRRVATDRAATSFMSFYPPHERWYDVHVYPAPDGGLSVYFRDATEIKRAEEKLRLNSQTFYNLIQNNPFGMFIVDADFRLRQVSLGAQKMFANVRPLLERDFAEVLRVVWPEPFASEAIGRFCRTLTTGYPFVSASTVERRQDTDDVEAYDWRIERVPLPDGRLGVVCYFYDLSERQRWEAAIRASGQRNAAVLDAAIDGIISMDHEGRVVEWNPAAERTFGYTRAEAIGREMAEMIIPAHLRDAHRAGLSNYLATGVGPVIGTRLEITAVRRDGTEFPVELSITRVSTDGPPMFTGFLRDISERKRADGALRTSEARFRALFESMDEGFCVVEMLYDETGRPIDYRFLETNPTFDKHTGFHQAVGRTIRELVPNHDAHWFDIYGAVAATGEPKRFVNEAKAMGRWYDVYCFRIGGTGSDRVAILFTDITERKAAEAERELLLASEKTARANAEQASRMKDEFLATLSHELRTPLNAILGWSQILSVGCKGDGDLAEGLRTIERNARAQTQIIEDLLDMSRIISGKVRLDVQRIELAPIVQAAVDTVRPAADAKAVRLQIVLDPLTGSISGDPNRLQQVFWNLLTNAVKFTPKGGRVQVLLERVNSHLEVNVIDTGEGISAEFLPYVFDRFRQADASTTRRHGGLGLGLAIVKQLVELHGGSIRASSPGKGHGATFTVSLPLTVVHAEPDPAVQRRHPRAANTPVLPDICNRVAGLKVLVVDDEPDARALLKRLLEDCKAVVIVAASAAEALERLLADPPDVLVSDIGMPGEDGYELIKRIRALGPKRGGNVPAVALTAYARAEDRMNAVVAGFQMHVAKPVEPAELITVIAALAK